MRLSGTTCSNRPTRRDRRTVSVRCASIVDFVSGFSNDEFVLLFEGSSVITAERSRQVGGCGAEDFVRADAARKGDIDARANLDRTDVENFAGACLAGLVERHVATVERRVCNAARQRKDQIFVEPERGSRQRRFERGHMTRIANELVRERHRQRIRGTARRHAVVPEPLPRPGLHGRLQSCADDRDCHGVAPASTNRTCMPPASANGSSASASNRRIVVWPMIGQPAGPGSA